MRVRMTIKISGTRDGKDWPDKGGEITVPDDEAEQLIRYGAAEAVIEPETDTTETDDEDDPEPEPPATVDVPEEPDEEETAAAPDTAETRPRSRRKA